MIEMPPCCEDEQTVDAPTKDEPREDKPREDKPREHLIELSVEHCRLDSLTDECCNGPAGICRRTAPAMIQTP
jgi:hypothetical protein